MERTYPGAYAFQCDLSLDDLQVKLNELGKWSWTGYDSDRYGDYLLARPDQTWTKLRIIGKPEDYLIEVSFFPRESGGKLAASYVSRQEIDRVLFEEVFPAIGARRVRKANGL